MLIDTHCHIYYSEVENAEEIIKECQKNNIVMILNGIDKKSNLQVLELSKKYDNVYAAIGYDHSVVNEITDEDLKLLENQLKNEKVVAIGEIGLDYYWVKDNKEKQKKLFIKELELAEKYNLPVIIHSRDAVQDVYDILKTRNLRGSIHCYSGSTEMAKEFIKIGFNIGIDGPITFKNNKKQREMVKNIDINHILVETDSPYLSPEPNRGKVNTSLNLVYILKQIAIELDREYEEIKELAAHCRYPVRFAGCVSQVELAKLYNDGDIFVLPSMYEGLPLTVIESLACGDRVVMTRLDGVADWLEDMIPDADIRYVDLPKMKGADEAVEEELPVFEKRLAQTLEDAIRTVKQENRGLVKNRACDVSRISWQKIAQEVIR